MSILETEVFRRALIALNIHDKKTAIITTENLVQGLQVEAIAKKYRCSKATVYRQIKKGRAYLLKQIGEDPWSATTERAESINRKFPKVTNNGSRD